MKDLLPDRFPINADLPLRPTKILFVLVSGGAFLSKTTAHDVTAISLSRGTVPTTESSLELLKQIHSKAGSQPVLVHLTRSTWFSTNMTARDADGEHVADLSNALWSLGRHTMSFPEDSTHSSHDIEMRPVDPGRKTSLFGKRTTLFAKESVPYFWNMSGGAQGSRLCVLFKVADGKRLEVARFVGRNRRDREGFLFVDGKAADEVVVALTCVVLLNRTDSFEK